MAAALEKIISHISNPRKFKRASPLLRQLLSQGSVQKAHASLLFEVPSETCKVAGPPGTVFELLGLLGLHSAP